MRASHFINEAIDSDAVNELDSFIQNDKMSQTINNIIDIGIKDFETNNKSINLNSFTKTQSKIIDYILNIIEKNW